MTSMPWLLVAPLLALAGAFVWTWRLHQLAVRRRESMAAVLAGPVPRVSIVVPARDEAENLPGLLASLTALEPPAHEIIIVDDHSSDGTADIARAAGAIVVAAPPLPAGWVGKSWACHAGAAVATGELVLFSDADTVHAPWSIATAVAEMQRSDADLVSVVPTHEAHDTWEHAQGAFQLLLAIATRAGARADVTGPRRFAIGQYLLFRRDAYQRIGGHAEVRARIAEDLALASRVVETGGRYHVACVPGLVGVRMYPSPIAFARGWRRSFRDGMSAGGVAASVEIALVITCLLGAPLGVLVAAITGAWFAALGWGIASIAIGVDIARRQRLVGALAWWGAFGYPIAVVAFVGISAASALDALLRRPVMWRGRAISTTRTAR